jgi:spore maturation protein CgeB
MRLNLVGPFIVNYPVGTEIAFSKGLKEIGHEVIAVDPYIDKEMVGLRNDADVTVVFKSCAGAEKYLSSLRHPIVVYQPDDARFPHIRQMMLEMRKYSNLFLSFDQHGADVAKTMGYRAAETLLLTADPDLYSPSPDPVQRDVDISFVGSLGDPVAHASRMKMCRMVEAEADKRGWKVAFGQSQNMPMVIDIYRRSKIVLNHATDVGQAFGFGFGLQCRHFEVGMTKTCLLSNRRLGLGEDVLETMPFIPFDDEYSLISQINYLLETGDWEKHGQHLYEYIQAGHTPAHRAQELVDFIKRNT